MSESVLPFSVHLGEDRDVPFAEMSGGAADGPVFYPIKMPGLGRVWNVVVLRRGFLPPNAKLWAWHDQAARGEITRRDVVIHLRNDAGHDVKTWTLHNAWPAKVVSPDGDVRDRETAIELVELQFESMSE